MFIFAKGNVCRRSSEPPAYDQERQGGRQGGFDLCWLQTRPLFSTGNRRFVAQRRVSSQSSPRAIGRQHRKITFLLAFKINILAPSYSRDYSFPSPMLWFRLRFLQTLEGSSSAVSTPTLSRKGVRSSVFQDSPHYLLRFQWKLQDQISRDVHTIAQNFGRFSGLSENVAESWSKSFAFFQMFFAGLMWVQVSQNFRALAMSSSKVGAFSSLEAMSGSIQPPAGTRGRELLDSALTSRLMNTSTRVGRGEDLARARSGKKRSRSRQSPRIGTDGVCILTKEANE